MKKLFTLMMLLVAIVTGANADTEINISGTVPTRSEGTGNYDNTTGLAVTGGTMYWSGLQDGSNAVTVGSVTYFKMGSNSAYVQLKLSGTEKFKAGDVLTATVTSNGSNKKVNVKVGSSSTNDVTVSSNETKTITYTLTTADIESDGSIKIYRDTNGSNLRIATFSVTGTRGGGSLIDPNLTLTSASSVKLAIDGQSTITYTTNSDGAVTFSSNKTNVAEVSGAGVISAKAGGLATVTVAQAATTVYDEAAKNVEVIVPYAPASDTEFIIGNGTYGFSDSSNNYYFTNGFDVSNNGNKSYGAGGLTGSVKYSAGTTYTINIPEGISIMSATVTGRSNYGNDKTAANWGTLFGTDYSSETLPYSNQDPAEKVINFESAQTGTLTFTPGGNQVQFIIVLSTEAQTVVPVTGVTIDEAAEVEAGKTVAPVYTVLPEDATNKSVTWSSDNESVATVENGVVTGVAAGTANITVTTVDGNFSDVCVVTVTAPVPVEKTLPYSEDFTTWGGTTWSQGNTSTPDVIKGITFYSKSSTKQFSASDDGLTFPDNNISSNNYFMAIQLTGVENSKIKITLTPASTSGKAAVKYILKDGETEVGTPGDGVIEASAANEGEDIVIFADCTSNDAILYLGRKSSDDQNKTFASIAIDYAKSNAITLNSNGFATYSSAYDFEYTGADAYGMELTATSLSGTKVTTGKIKAGEGILFKGEANAPVTITESTGAAALENNSLIGTTDINNEVISPLSYTHKYALNGDTFKTFTGALVANKAFFGTNEELSNSLDLIFDGATAVEAIAEANEADAEVPVKVIKNGQLYIGNYNVAGARVK